MELRCRPGSNTNFRRRIRSIARGSMMHQAVSFAAAVSLVGLVALGPTSVRAADAANLYTITKTVPLGSPERWDYVTYDRTSHRVYAAHGTSIVVLDGHSGT